MKIKICGTVILLTALALCNKSIAQYANKSLSNLTSPTAVNQTLLPGKNAQYNLGSPSKSWLNLFLSKKIYFNNVLSIYVHGADDFFAGPNAGNLTYTGVYNVGFGSNALHQVTSGGANTAAGWHALFYDSSGTGNTANGAGALYSNTNGNNNTAVGQSALYTNRTGSDNIAVGAAALGVNDAGNDNIAIGNDALGSNTADENIAIGGATLTANTSGHNNIGIGFLSLTNNTVGNYNVANGYQALAQNSTGNDNTANGAGALAEDKVSYNTATGSDALTSNTYGAYNTANGIGALFINATGSYNIADGAEAGYNVTDGSYNTFVGYFANCGSGGHITNSTAIGNGASVTSNNHVVIGNSSVTSIGGYVNWTKLSDGRVKKNIKQNVPGLAFINKLQPITYNLDLDAADKIIDRPQIKNKEGKIIQPTTEELQSRKAKEQIIYTGFVAQDVEKAAQSLQYDFSGVDKPDNANTLYGLRYSDFVVPLVKAVQELSKINDDKESEISTLKEQLDNQQKQIDELKSMIVGKQSAVNSEQLTINNSASLQQNIPNPFSNATTINYSLPAKFISAKIIITDKNGSALKTITLSNNTGSVNVDAATLSSGAYQYSLYVEGRLIDTKQMILSK